MTAAVEQLVVTRPGVYQMPAEDYHRDPVEGGSLSASGARDLLPPSCPALYRYKRDNDPPARHVWEIGHAAHKLVLGVGPDLVRVDADEWRTNAIKAEVAEIRKAGAMPLKPAEWDMVHAMAEKLREHPVASALFDPARGGRPEQSLFWVDQPTGIWRRARLDWLPVAPGRGNIFGRVVLADYKTSHTAAPDKLSGIMDDLGYHSTAAWYIDAVKALGLADSAAFVLVFQEKKPPYLVTVAEPDPEALRIGALRNREALRIYAECMASGRWPGYSDDVTYLALPPWVLAQYPREVIW